MGLRSSGPAYPCIMPDPIPCLAVPRPSHRRSKWKSCFSVRNSHQRIGLLDSCIMPASCFHPWQKMEDMKRQYQGLLKAVTLVQLRSSGEHTRFNASHSALLLAVTLSSTLPMFLPLMRLSQFV